MCKCDIWLHLPFLSFSLLHCILFLFFVFLFFFFFFFFNLFIIIKLQVVGYMCTMCRFATYVYLNLLTDTWFANVFSHCIGCFSLYFICCAEVFKFDVVSIAYFCFCCLYFYVMSKKSLSNLMS